MRTQNGLFDTRADPVHTYFILLVVHSSIIIVVLANSGQWSNTSWSYTFSECPSLTEVWELVRTVTHEDNSTLIRHAHIQLALVVLDDHSFSGCINRVYHNSFRGDLVNREM